MRNSNSLDKKRTGEAWFKDHYSSMNEPHIN
jgi:hypothetical protein